MFSLPSSHQHKAEKQTKILINARSRYLCIGVHSSKDHESFLEKAFSNLKHALLAGKLSGFNCRAEKGKSICIRSLLATLNAYTEQC